MLYQTRYPSPLGIITLVCDDDALLHLSLPGQGQFPHAADGWEHPILDRAAAWLDRYFAGEAPSPDELPLAPQGSAFRKLIWKLLLDIPYGQTSTYGALARDAARLLGRPRMSAQAVGGAVGANPIAIVIPCHRVIGADGSLVGYAGGLHYKQRLLSLEGFGRA